MAQPAAVFPFVNCVLRLQIWQSSRRTLSLRHTQYDPSHTPSPYLAAHTDTFPTAAGFKRTQSCTRCVPVTVSTPRPEHTHTHTLPTQLHFSALTSLLTCTISVCVTNMCKLVSNSVWEQLCDLLLRLLLCPLKHLEQRHHQSATCRNINILSLLLLLCPWIHNLIGIGE